MTDPDSTIIVVPDGVEIAESKGTRVTDSLYKKFYYRDENLIKGNTYSYTYCCQYHTSTGKVIKSCGGRGRTVSTGNIGGTIKQDLYLTGESLVISEKIRVTENATLSILNSNIEVKPDAYYTDIDGRGTTFKTQITTGNIRIQDSILSADIDVIFASSSGNLLSGSTLNGSKVTMLENAGVQVNNNELTEVDFIIEDNSIVSFLANQFLQSEIRISQSEEGIPDVLVSGNEFQSDSYKSIYALGGKITIKNSTFRGSPFTYTNGTQGINATAIWAASNDAETPVEIVVTDNLFTGYNHAIDMSRHIDADVIGNVFINNNQSLKISYGGIKLAASENTFSTNKYALNFSTGSDIGNPEREISINVNNNCLMNNSIFGINNPEGFIIDATNNWWGHSSGPYHYLANPSGSGDSIQTPISISPWLTAENCEQTPSIPESPGATIAVTTSTSSIAADGRSQSILTISLHNENNQPLANAELTLGTPEFGTLDRLSGTTDASGKLLINYTAPTASELNGKDFIELSIQYSKAAVSDSTIINFTFASVSVWADPHIAPYPSDVAIIPGDSRFPGRYQFTLRDHAGQVYAAEVLNISIIDSKRARLEGGGQSGKQVNVITDEQGKAFVDYIYLGSPEIGNAPFEDTIIVSHKSMSEALQAKVSVGLDIEIADVNTPQRDAGVFPKTLGMRLLLADGFRPDMDLRAYLSELEEISGNNIAAEVVTEWLNPPKEEFIDTFRTIFPNYANDDPPQLYTGTGVINYGDNKLKQVIVEALDSPQVGFGANTLPAIIFEDPGNYWFRVQANPVILLEGVTSSTDYVRGASHPDLGIMFGANVLEEAESVFQSVVCSVKTTNKEQFLAMTLLVDNPYSSFIPSSAGIKMVVKASGIICDYMKGNYATAAINMASLGTDGLENAYTSGALDISLEQYLKLGKIVKLNQAYSKLDNMKGATETLFPKKSAKRAADHTSFINNWPEDLSLAEYKDVMNKTISGEMGAYDDLNQWQFFGIFNDGAVDMSRYADETTEYFSHNGVHVYLLPSGADTLYIKTSSDADIFRFYRAAADITSQLNFSLLEAELKIDTGADGTIDNSFSPEVKKVDSTWTALEIITNQDTYQAGDTLIISATLENPGDALLVDVHFSVTGPTGELYSIPDLSPGHTPMVTNFKMPGHFILPETTIFSFPVPGSLSGAGQFKIEAFLSYPATLDAVGGNISSKIISFP